MDASGGHIGRCRAAALHFYNLDLVMRRKLQTVEEITWLVRPLAIERALTDRTICRGHP